MNANVYLITGPSGAGKSTLAEYLTEQGYTAIDLDSAPGICYFANKVGKPVPYPADADARWWENHNYLWELSRLGRAIEALEANGKPIFVCGNAGNIKKAWDMFAGVIYLDVPKDVMMSRLKTSERENSFGKRVVEQDVLLSWVDGFKAEMLEAGAISIDATKPLKVVSQAVLDTVKATPSA